MSTPKKVYDSETIVLQDGTVVELKPLVISKAKKARRIWTEAWTELGKRSDAIEALKEKNDDEAAAKLENEYNEDDLVTDAMVLMAGICIDGQKGLENVKDDVEKLESILDQRTLNRIIYVCLNIDIEGAEGKVREIQEAENISQI